ncbi:unnamed protein product [Brassica oleracea]
MIMTRALAAAIAAMVIAAIAAMVIAASRMMNPINSLEIY